MTKRKVDPGTVVITYRGRPAYVLRGVTATDKDILHRWLSYLGADKETWGDWGIECYVPSPDFGLVLRWEQQEREAAALRLLKDS